LNSDTYITGKGKHGLPFFVSEQNRRSFSSINIVTPEKTN